MDEDAVDLAKQDSVICRIPYECGKVYIGETISPMQDRIKKQDRGIWPRPYPNLRRFRARPVSPSITRFGLK